jgi:hypothetical protein
MTKLTKTKTYLTEGASEKYDENGVPKPLIIEVGPFNISYRIKGCHQSYAINHESAYLLAVKQYANSQSTRQTHTVNRGKV